MRFYTPEGKIRYSEVRACTERIANMKRERARQILQTAGCSIPSLHNALVGLHYGQPWREVDYKKAKLARHILDHEFDASKVLRELYTRKGCYSFDWN